MSVFHFGAGGGPLVTASGRWNWRLYRATREGMAASASTPLRTVASPSSRPWDERTWDEKQADPEQVAALDLLLEEDDAMDESEGIPMEEAIAQVRAAMAERRRAWASAGK